jgi:hypothetical protein
MERCDDREAPGFCKPSAAGSGIPLGETAKRRGIKGRSPFARKRKSRLMAGFQCGVVDDYRTYNEDFITIFLFGVELNNNT